MWTEPSIRHFHFLRNAECWLFPSATAGKRTEYDSRWHLSHTCSLQTEWMNKTPVHFWHLVNFLNAGERERTFPGKYKTISSTIGITENLRTKSIHLNSVQRINSVKETCLCGTVMCTKHSMLITGFTFGSRDNAMRNEEKKKKKSYYIIQGQQLSEMQRIHIQNKT